MAVERMNETDVRTRIVVPFFKRLGFGPGEIRTEQHFRVRLGRTAVEIGSGERRDQMQGFLDILVRSQEGHSLFMVEPMSSDHSSGESRWHRCVGRSQGPCPTLKARLFTGPFSAWSQSSLRTCEVTSGLDATLEAVPSLHEIRTVDG